MAAEVAGAYCLQWSQSLFPPRSHFLPKTLPFSFSSYSSIAYALHIGQQSPFLGTALFQFCNCRGRARGGRRWPSPSPSLDGFVDDDEDEVGIEESIYESAIEFKLVAESRLDQDAEITQISKSDETDSTSNSPVFGLTYTLPLYLTPEIPAMPHDPWPTCDALATEMVERRADCFDLPLSLRILQRKKKRWENAVMNDFACCPVRMAFSSMVFIVDLLQSYTIRMRGPLFSSSEDQIQRILAKVRDELHATFIWLFQYIFITTPSLMVYLMLLVANFTVFSITDYPDVDALPPQPISVAVEESESPTLQFESTEGKALSSGRSSTVGSSCDDSNGWKLQSDAGASGDDGWDRFSSSPYNGGTNSTEKLSTAAAEKDCARAWKGILQEAERIQANDRHEALTDPDTLRRFVTPVAVELEPEDLSACSGTELSYRRALAEDPDDPLILSNFAQFLYLVLRDHNSAEEYFKRAVMAAPVDAEALCRYANFLWVARGDLGTAEETFLEAVAADPGNSHYSASYAHFLWSTGGDDTCYPLDGCEV